MDHAITLGDVLIASGIVIGVIAVAAVLFAILAAYAKGMSQ